MDRNSDTKKKLAVAVADMVKNGESLFLDVGSTTAYVAQALQNHQDLYIVTNSTAVAQMLTGRNNNRVFLAGGELRALDGAAFGQDALGFINKFNVKYAVMSVAAINARSGFMLYDIEEVDISLAAIKLAEIGIVVADSSKYGRKAPITMPAPEDINLLVTDAQPDAPIAAMLAQNDITVNVVP